MMSADLASGALHAPAAAHPLVRVTAVISMLHEPASTASGEKHRCRSVRRTNSGQRPFRGEAVLNWTLRRIESAQRITDAVILCWEDQMPDVGPIAESAVVCVLIKGPRVIIPSLESISAARKWEDGWRGGLLGACEFDLGFHGGWIAEIREQTSADAVVLVDPAAALVDPGLLDSLIEHAEANPDQALCFAPAAPGLGGVLLRPEALQSLRRGHDHPGRSLHYLPDAPIREPLGGGACAPVPAPAARTLHRFTIDSDRAAMRISAAMHSLNGQLITSGAERLVSQMDSGGTGGDAWPREVVIELTTERRARPIFSPLGHRRDIPDRRMDPATAREVFRQLAGVDDIRITFAGIGDPLLHPEVSQILAEAIAAPIHAVHVQTDLLGIADRLIDEGILSEIDVLSVHLPGVTPQVYAAVMGVDESQLHESIEGIRRLAELRQACRRGTPLIVPVFTKCGANLAEMESWYDQWLRALGCAVIAAPGDLAGKIPDCAVADMSPPRRSACRRLSSRMTILADGAIVACEQDVWGRFPLGRVGTDSIQAVWRDRIDAMRSIHGRGLWNQFDRCRRCREWHRP